jgi:membrane associated rhomboid family serine protease
MNAVWVIIAVNFLFYIATVVSPDIRVTLGLIPAVWLERPWTIVTNLFIHGSFWHIFGNMITLFFFGTYLARWVGDGKFLLVYFGGGILGNFIYIWLGEPYSIAIGASGAVFALAGALAVMAPNLRLFVYFIIPMRLWVAVLLFFVLWSFLPGIAWQAHLGGLVGGLIAGYIFRRQGMYYYG